MGLTTNRLKRVHMLDSLFDPVNFVAIVRTSQIQRDKFGSVSFAYKLVSPGVSMLMFLTVFATVVLYASCQYFSGNMSKHMSAFWNQVFVLWATSMNQGTMH